MRARLWRPHGSCRPVRSFSTASAPCAAHVRAVCSASVLLVMGDLSSPARAFLPHGLVSWPANESCEQQSLVVWEEAQAAVFTCFQALYL